MKQQYILVALYIILAGFVIHWLFDNTNLHTFNYIYSFTPQKQFDDRIAILTLDDDSARNLKSGSVPSRTQFAQAINNLTELGAKLIVIDVVFKGKKPEDAILVKAMKDSGRVIISAYYAEAMEGQQQGEIELHFDNSMTDEARMDISKKKLSFIPDYFLDNADLGIINIDKQFVVRGLSPYIRIGEIKYPRLYQRTMEKFFDDSKGKIVEEGNSKYLLVGDRKMLLSGNETGKNLHTNELLINYQGIEYDFQHSYSPFYSIIAGNWKETAELYKDKIVFIIPATLVSQDIMNAPRLDGLRQQSMYRGMLHINLVNQILKKKFVEDFPQLFVKIGILIFLCLFSFICYHISLVKGILLLFFMISGYSGLSFFIFSKYRIVGLNFILFDLMILIGFFIVTGFKYLNERKIRSIFKRYVGSKVLNEVIKNKDSAELFKGKKCELTVLLIDIRGFTSLSEELGPEETVNVLNDFFNLVTRSILCYEGTVDKFMGDAVLAFFGAPVEISEKEKKAVQCCLDIFKKLETFVFNNKKISIGISITTGEVVVGNIGSIEKLEYTIIGPAVNLAARLETLNKKYGTSILIDETTADRSKLIDHIVEVGEEEIRGFSQKKKIFTFRKEGE